MLPAILAKQLEKGIGDYIETTFPMTNEPFEGSIQNMLATPDSVFHEPYVAVHLPLRVAGQMPTCFEAVHPSYLPYLHQAQAFERLTGDDGRSTLIATGTGSGKTECFLYPILEYCYKHRGEKGIKALIVYPMNALASDQAKRIAELIYNSPELRGNVTAGMYTGGRQKTPSQMMSESGIITDHETMLASAPDILMTNYKMLDYLLVRPRDAALWEENNPYTLKYIAVDELHTFDGAQGTDLACLLRRLKRRLGTDNGYLCCIGTSATMGSKEESAAIRGYASEVFGESFEEDSVLTENRLSATEFFTGWDITEFSMPTEEQVSELDDLVDQDDNEAYLRAAASYWFDGLEHDVLTMAGRLELGEKLMHHSFLQSVISLMGGSYYQARVIADELKVNYPELAATQLKETLVYSLFALISHARSGSEESPRPFLHVQVQLWMRELRRLLAKVSGNQVTYALSQDLNEQQARHYLPVVNCRDCGATGWVTRLSEQQDATLTNLDVFYNLYFKADGSITMLFPGAPGETMKEMLPAKLCPECLHVKVGYEVDDHCESCGATMIPVLIPNPIPTTGSGEHKQYKCPFCGSSRGISLIGLRSATEISASISQMFASKFNDDKKTLAFSDNVQDAAHRAGFFNSRTWRFGLRTAVQRVIAQYGGGQSLASFTKGFLDYWHGEMDDEAFVSFFIGPNMTWMHAYEDMIKNRKLAKDEAGRRLMADVEKRVSYEIMLEYGMTARIGRTLEKSGCSMLSFDMEAVYRIAAVVQERTINELAIMQDSEDIEFLWMVLGYLNVMRLNGAFADGAFYAFTANQGKSYLISSDHVHWMPGLRSGRNTPRFIAEPAPKDRSKYHFDALSGKRYSGWVASCCSQMMVEESCFDIICKYILTEAVKEKVVLSLPSPAEYTVYGLNKAKVHVTEGVRQMRCDWCGSVYAVPAESAELWQGAPCQRWGCSGHIFMDETAVLDYYGKLYNSGDLERINAREHTGLLERDDRERLEIDFKRNVGKRELWDPNVLSCTPTLEMGIDIGDLSTVILCSMPPAQAQFLQRAGRAGRMDGNALTLAVANARPHDLYFYADPMEMIAGSVEPPRVFLQASSVLERQFVAYCMDTWVKRGVGEQAIPKNVGIVLGKLEKAPRDVFPFNFLNYVQSNLSYQIRSFIEMFSPNLDRTTKNEIKRFAQGDKLSDSPMHVRVLETFLDLKKQRDSLQKSIRELAAMVKALEAKPKDSSFDAEIAELKSEQTALRNVVRALNKKDVFNFLSDEGLLPNYAFPESGIVLKAVLYRKEDSEEAEKKRKYEKMVYEYNRGASSAISEFAPMNNFYAGGRKLTINQVDITTMETEKWRLCPNCAHAKIEVAGEDVACCPRCGSPAWADSGQVRTMLRVKMVYSNMDYTKSLISDESDDRTNVFYCKQMLVDVDDDKDIESAYRMDNEEFPFGYEFVRNAVLREINFGESDMVGERLMVSGVEEVRKGFKICKYCGTIQTDRNTGKHTAFCKIKKNPALDNDPFEECLFLYREFQTEILRLLIPATTMDASRVRTESFVAAFMLGMKEYFGNVDHLRATVSEVPGPDMDYRKQYLVIYDSVPGGTGYLKQLMHEKNALTEVFEKALFVLENCSCRDDPQKDGCYHCLYAYRQSQYIGSISRATAIHQLKAILSGKEGIEKIDKLGNVPVNSLFDSELERLFIEAMAQMGDENRKVTVTKSLVHNKEGYLLRINEATWEIEPQVVLDASQGVAVTCKPDFIIWPVRTAGQKPVAVFTDGYLYHKDKVADDTLKREAICRSGAFRVWSLSWRDVQSVFRTQGDYATNPFQYNDMPSGTHMYQQTVSSSGKAGVLKPEKMSAMELLVRYLSECDAEEGFAIQAYAYSLSLLDYGKMANVLSFLEWEKTVKRIIADTHLTGGEFRQGDTIFGIWSPRKDNIHLRMYGGASLTEMQTDPHSPVAVCAVLDDEKDHRTDHYEKEWNGFWQFFNVMQFSPSFMAIAQTGLAQMIYQSLPATPMESVVTATTGLDEVTDAWKEVYELLLDEKTRAFAKGLSESGIPAPNEDEVGYELTDDCGKVLAMAEMAWPGKKIAYIPSEQRGDAAIFAAHGWTVIDEGIDSIGSLFGGETA